MRRREFLSMVDSAVAAWPLAARAQQAPKLLCIGTVQSIPRDRPGWRALEQRLRELGYVEGGNLVIDYSTVRE